MITEQRQAPRVADPAAAHPTHLVYLAPAEFVDSDHPSIRTAAAVLAPHADPADRARALYYEVRDGIAYRTSHAHGQGSMADYLCDLETYRASSVLAARSGFCVSKAALYVALCRAAGIPARVGFADVVNSHYSGRRVRGALGTDVFAWHGYSEVLLHDRWIKLTPMMEGALGRRLGVPRVEFDERAGGLLPATDERGNPAFGYLRQHGAFHDVPARFLAAELSRRYPGMRTFRPLR